MFIWQLLTATSVRCTAGELGNLGRVHHNQGHLKKARDYYYRARAIFFWKSFDLTMFMWQLLTAVWVRYTGIIVHSSFYIKRSSDLGMLTLQIFIITWTPTLRESRRLGDLNLGKAWLRWLCAGISPKSRRSNLTRFTSHAIFRRLTLHWCRGAAKAYWFSVELPSVLDEFMAAEDLVASAWSQSQTKNVSLLTGVLSSPLEEKGKDYSRTPRSLFMKASRVVLRGGVYGGGPSPMERPSFANKAG